MSPANGRAQVGPSRRPRGNLLPTGPWRAPGLFLSLRRAPSSRRDPAFAVTSPLRGSASEVSLAEAPSLDTGSWSSAGPTTQVSQLGCLSLHPPTRGVNEALSGPGALSCLRAEPRPLLPEEAPQCSLTAPPDSRPPLFGRDEGAWQDPGSGRPQHLTLECGIPTRRFSAAVQLLFCFFPWLDDVSSGLLSRPTQPCS